jgi:hypothetical protein
MQGPGPGGRVVRTMDYTPVNGQTLKDFYGYRLYDTIRFVAGTAVSTAIFSFFQIPLGGQTAGQNFATQYTKTKIDTNLGSAGLLSKGRYFEVHSMQVRALMTGATDTTYGSSGINTQLPTNALGAAVISATNEAAEILEQGYMSFIMDDKTYEEGKLIHFPTPYGLSGFAGSGSPGGSGAGTDTIAVVNNGFGRPYRLPIPRQIDGLRSFRVDMQFPGGFTPNRNFKIEVCLEGGLYRPVV